MYLNSEQHMNPLLVECINIILVSYSQVNYAMAISLYRFEAINEQANGRESTSREVRILKFNISASCSLLQARAPRKMFLEKSLSPFRCYAFSQNKKVDFSLAFDIGRMMPKMFHRHVSGSGADRPNHLTKDNHKDYGPMYAEGSARQLRRGRNRVPRVHVHPVHPNLVLYADLT